MFGFCLINVYDVVSDSQFALAASVLSKFVLPEFIESLSGLLAPPMKLKQGIICLCVCLIVIRITFKVTNLFSRDML